jgi:hypothetical protein
MSALPATCADAQTAPAVNQSLCNNFADSLSYMGEGNEHKQQRRKYKATQDHWFQRGRTKKNKNTKERQMNFKIKTSYRFALCASFLNLCLHCSGQYAIPWSVVAGGGGTCSGGSYLLSGTVGQADAGGPMSGGSYSLTGGFWAFGAAVPVPPGPTLYIAHSGALVLIYWQDVPGWTLQQTPSLSQPPAWSPSSGVTTSNGTNYLTLTSPAGSQFFRLKH